jgi:hypothetical protein
MKTKRVKGKNDKRQEKRKRQEKEINTFVIKCEEKDEKESGII